jgi:hypothetical protein
MLTFPFQGLIADVDETVVGEPFHPVHDATELRLLDAMH